MSICEVEESVEEWVKELHDVAVGEIEGVEERWVGEAGLANVVGLAGRGEE